MLGGGFIFWGPPTVQLPVDRYLIQTGFHGHQDHLIERTFIKSKTTQRKARANDEVMGKEGEGERDIKGIPASS